MDYIGLSGRFVEIEKMSSFFIISINLCGTYLLKVGTYLYFVFRLEIGRENISHANR